MATESRRGRWLPLVYYYLATVVGLVIMLIGLITGLQGLIDAAFPSLSDDVRYASPEYAPPQPQPGDEKAPREPTAAEVQKAKVEAEKAKEDATERARLGGFAKGLRGLVSVVVGAPVFFWHLRQARRKEPEWMGSA